MKTLHKINLFAFLFAVMLLNSCDYPFSPEYMSGLRPPLDSIDVELSFLNAGDTLQLFSPQNFSYNFNAIKDQFLYGRFIMGDKEWEVSNIIGNIRISPDNFPPGYNTILLQVYYSGTGSIADQSGAEIYLTQRSWTILCDSRPAPLLTLSHHKNENGFLTLTWTPHENYNFEAYQIERTGYNILSLEKTFNHRDTLTFVDSCYFAGHAKYTIRAMSKGFAGWGGTDENSSIELILETPVMQFEMLSLDSLLISWAKPQYNAMHNITTYPAQGGPFILYASTDTSVVVPMPLFGLETGFSLATYPIYGSKCFMGGDLHSAQLFYPEKFETILQTPAQYAYNKNENIIYTIDRQKNLLAYNMEKLEIKSSYLISDYEGFPFTTSNNSSLVAVSGEKNIYIFQDSNLQDPIIIPFQNQWYRTTFLFLTENGYVANVYSSQLNLFDINSKQIVATVSIPNTQIQQIAMSADASFVAFLSKQFGLWIYENNNFKYEEVFVNYLPYTSFGFHPAWPNSILLVPSLGNILELRSIPDFSLEQSWQLPYVGMNIGNIDPYTGYMLLHKSSEKQIIIMDLETNEQILSVPSSDSSPRFYKHRLFSGSGYTLNLSDYLPM